MIRAIAISKRFGRTLALDGVDFEARPGEIHALVGENGAGKTTLMKVLAGSLAPDSGEASLDERPLQAGSPRAALAAGIAAVHQSPMLFERMTWEENLALGGFDTGAEVLDLAAVASRARALAAKLGFELPPANTTVENRSVAERVRLEVLRALSFNPRVLILDEPTSVLAPSELAAFLDLLRNLRAEGRIVVLITHKLGEAMAVADRITVLRRGRVVARTTPAETSEEKLAGLMIGELVTQPVASGDRESGRVGAANRKSESGRSHPAQDSRPTFVRRRRRRDRWNSRGGRQRADRAGRVACRCARAERRQNNFERRDGGDTAESRPRRPDPRHAAVGEPDSGASDPRAGDGAWMAEHVARDRAMRRADRAVSDSRARS